MNKLVLHSPMEQYECFMKVSRALEEPYTIVYQSLRLWHGLAWKSPSTKNCDLLRLPQYWDPSLKFKFTGDLFKPWKTFKEMMATRAPIT